MVWIIIIIIIHINSYNIYYDISWYRLKLFFYKYKCILLYNGSYFNIYNLYLFIIYINFISFILLLTYITLYNIYLY